MWLNYKHYLNVNKIDLIILLKLRPLIIYV
jgi:hypothetical protein